MQLSSLNLKEYLVSVKEPQKKPFDCESTQRQYQRRGESGIVGKAPEEEFGYSAEVNEPLQEINRYWIDTDNNEEK
jgi:hypothetical protein